MISYILKCHTPGKIRIKIPLLKSMTLTGLKALAERLSEHYGHEGIIDISANPLTGSVTITYDPAKINITAYIRDVASSREVQHLILQDRKHA
jgi:cell division protein FtsX